MAGCQQRVDGGVPGPDPVGEPVAPPGRVRLLLRRRRFVGFLLPVGDQDAQALAVAGDCPLSGLAEVVPQVPPVSDLDGLGCPGCGAFREERCAAPADDLDSGSLRQPCSQAGRLPVRQQIHRPAGLDVDQHRAVDPSFTGGVLINTHHPRGGDFGFRQRVEQPQHRAATDGHPRRPVPSGRRPGRRGRDRPRRGSTATAPSTCCAAGSAPVSAQRTFAEHTKAPDRRTAGLAVGGPPDVPRWARPQETAGKSCAPGSTLSHSPGMPPRPPYCRRRCVSPCGSHPTTAPTRPRWTVTAAPPSGAKSFPRRRTVDHTKIDPGHFQATSRSLIQGSAVTQRARITESEPEPLEMNEATRVAVPLRLLVQIPADGPRQAVDCLGLPRTLAAGPQRAALDSARGDASRTSESSGTGRPAPTRQPSRPRPRAPCGAPRCLPSSERRRAAAGRGRPPAPHTTADRRGGPPEARPVDHVLAAADRLPPTVVPVHRPIRPLKSHRLSSTKPPFLPASNPPPLNDASLAPRHCRTRWATGPTSRPFSEVVAFARSAPDPATRPASTTPGWPARRHASGCCQWQGGVGPGARPP